MTLASLISQYGLAALFLGSGIEGEAVVVTGGMLAQRHLVPLGGVMLASATGSCTIDQLWFFLGRYCRRFRWIDALLRKPAAARAVDLIERYPRSFIFGFRFVYGMRTVSPIVIGASAVSTRTFVLPNILAAAVWGPLFTLAGYLFGKAAQKFLDRIEASAPYVVGALIAGGVAVVAIVIFRRRKSQSSKASSSDGRSSCTG